MCEVTIEELPIPGPPHARNGLRTRPVLSPVGSVHSIEDARPILSPLRLPREPALTPEAAPSPLAPRLQVLPLPQLREPIPTVASVGRAARRMMGRGSLAAAATGRGAGAGARTAK